MIFLNSSADPALDVELHPTLLSQGVLVVDDSQLQRKSAEQCLAAFGVQPIFEAGDGQQALAFLKQAHHPPAVILLDLEMPVLDGIEVLQQLATEQDVPAIILASSSDEVLLSAVSAMAEALQLPLLGAFRKPLHPAQLAAALASFAPRKKLAAQPPAAATKIALAELKAAIEGCQIKPFYQPKIALEPPRLAGLEVLARWSDRRQQQIPPARFIRCAEQNHLIGALTLSILDQVLDDMVSWNQQGFSIAAAINLSAVSLADPHMANAIIQRVAEREVPAQQLTFEITESALVIDMPSALATISRLRLKGFGCSIDDYGTGFSSMQQLSRLPFSELKIDRSFVRHAPKRQHLRNILASAIDMGRRLAIATVAEGVEHESELRLLQSLGCKQVQGFLFAHPMPGGAVMPWLQEKLPGILALCQAQGYAK